MAGSPRNLLMMNPLMRDAVPAQELHRAVKRREHAALVDVAHQKDRSLCQLCRCHVHDVHVHQVDLGRAARAFEHDDVMRFCQSPVGCGNRLPGFCPERIILRCLHVAVGLAVDDHLGTHVARCLEQDGVHVHASGRTRAASACSAWALPISPPSSGDEGIERHVLGLEGRDAHSLVREDPAERRRDQTLARA